VDTVIYTSDRAVSLRRVVDDVAEVMRQSGLGDIRVVYGPNLNPSTYKGCDAALTVMSFDPIWAKPFFLLTWLLGSYGLRTAFYTTVEGFPRRHSGDEWIYRDMSFIANSRYTASRIAKVGARVREVVYHGVNSERVRAFGFLRGSIRSQMGLSDRDFVVGYLAGGYRRKGHDLFAQAIKAVAAKDPSIKFVVVTQPDATGHYSGLENAVVSDQFGQLGDDYVYGFYHACDLYAQPSLSEGFGMPVLESLAAGVPVVHADYMPLSEVTSPETSFRVPVKARVVERSPPERMIGIDFELHYYDPAEFAEAIIQAKDEVSRDREEYRARCVERASLFEATKTYTRLAEILRG